MYHLWLISILTKKESNSTASMTFAGKNSIVVDLFRNPIASYNHLLLFSLSYSDKRAYGQSKLANILHANELSRQLQVAFTHTQTHISTCLVLSQIHIHLRK